MRQALGGGFDVDLLAADIKAVDRIAIPRAQRRPLVQPRHQLRVQLHLHFLGFLDQRLLISRVEEEGGFAQRLKVARHFGLLFTPRIVRAVGFGNLTQVTHASRRNDKELLAFVLAHVPSGFQVVAGALGQVIH